MDMDAVRVLGRTGSLVPIFIFQFWTLKMTFVQYGVKKFYVLLTLLKNIYIYIIMNNLGLWSGTSYTFCTNKMV